MKTIPYFEKLPCQSFYNNVVNKLISFGNMSKLEAEEQFSEWENVSIFSPLCSSENGYQSIRHYIMSQLEMKIGTDNTHKILVREY